MCWGKLYAKVASRCAQSRCFCSYRQILLLTVSGTTIWHKIILFTTAYVPMVQAPVMSVVMPTVPVVSSSVTAGISFSLFPYFLWHNCQFSMTELKKITIFLILFKQQKFLLSIRFPCKSSCPWNRSWIQSCYPHCLVSRRSGRITSPSPRFVFLYALDSPFLFSGMYFWNWKKWGGKKNHFTVAFWATRACSVSAEFSPFRNQFLFALGWEWGKVLDRALFVPSISHVMPLSLISWFPFWLDVDRVPEKI